MTAAKDGRVLWNNCKKEMGLVWNLVRCGGFGQAIKKKKSRFFLVCYKAPPQYSGGGFKGERHRQPGGHLKMGGSGIGMSVKSLDKAAEGSE